MGAQTSEIHDHILAEIVSGRLRPGDGIDEAAIAVRFGVSKTPIREAILQLEAEEVVEKRPRAGARVARLAADQLIELIELHSELEGAAAFHAARRATSEQKEQLQLVAGAYAARAGAGNDAYDLNLAFHMSVFRAANNQALSRLIDQTGVRLVSYFRAQEGLRRAADAAVAEHGDIVAAIVAGQADLARAAMRRHGEIASDMLLDVLAAMKA